MKLYVGNLSFQSTEHDLRTAMEQFGEVRSVSIINDRDTGRSKGFGFVEMNDEDAANAISALNGTELQGRRLTVNQAKPLPRRAAEGTDSFDARGSVSRRGRGGNW